jgi:hypothetical protein
LVTNKHFFKEEMDSKLRNYGTFCEGGARLQLEQGRPTTMAEISVNVIIHKKEDDMKQVFFNADITVQEARDKMCAEFGTGDDFKPEKFTVYRVDAFEEPKFPVRRINQQLTKCSVQTGDLLILKSDKDIDPEDKLRFSLHLTATGISQDSKYLEDIDVFREYTLNELKEVIMDLPSLKQLHPRNIPTVDHIRLREK